jgi:hypothetical protein
MTPPTNTKLRLTVERRTLLHGEMLEAGAIVVFTPSENSATVTHRVVCTPDSLRALLECGALTNVDGTVHDASAQLLPNVGHADARVLPIGPRLSRASR